MKKSILMLIATVCFLQVTVVAQNARVGMLAGLTSSNQFGEVGGVKLDYKSRGGYTFGIIVDAPLCKSKFSFQPGLHYVQKGAEISETNDTKSYLALRYIELQANFLVNASGDKTGGTFFAGLGPTLSMGLPSKSAVKNKRDKTISETSIIWGDEGAANFRGVDYGANLLAGFRFKKGFMFSFNYTIGIANLEPNRENGNEIRNGSFGLRLGVLINNK